MQEELTEKHFEDHVAELVKSKLQKPRKLGTYLARWRLELLMARFDWQRVDTEVAMLRQLSHAELVDFVDRVLLSDSYGRQLSVNVRGLEERQRCEADRAANGAAANGTKGANGVCAGADGAAAGSMPHSGHASSNGDAARSNGAVESHDAARNGASAADGHRSSGAHAHDGASGKLLNDAASEAQCGAAISEVVMPQDIPAFRMRQQLWPLTRRKWF